MYIHLLHKDAVGQNVFETLCVLDSFNFLDFIPNLNLQ